MLDKNRPAQYLFSMAADIFKIPNLLSLGRLLLLIPAGYFMAQPGGPAKWYALLCLTVAGFSDYFDGYLARRLDQRTSLGLILDPLSDKIMAATLIVLLMLYRDFPLWLAAVILGRDLLILIGGLIIKARTGQILPSSLSGKYCFAAIAVLLVSHVIDFEFGIRLFTVLMLALTALSIIMYGRTFIRVMRGAAAPVFADRIIYWRLRSAGSLIVIIVFFWQFGRFLGWL